MKVESEAQITITLTKPEAFSLGKRLDVGTHSMEFYKVYGTDFALKLSKMMIQFGETGDHHGAD